MTGGDQARAEGAALRELLAKATPGPWWVEYPGDFGDKHAIIPDILRERYGKNPLNFGEDHATAEFVAAAVNALPGLLDRLEAAEATLARVEDALLDLRNQWWHTGGTPCVPRRVLGAALLPSPSPQQPDGHDHTRESEDQG